VSRSGTSRTRSVFLVGLCLALALPGCGGRQAERLAAEQSLRAALSGHRPLEPRISLDLAYAPCPEAGAASGAAPCTELAIAGHRQRRELLAAIKRLQRSLARAPAPAARRGAALLALILGGPDRVPRAVAGLDALAGTVAASAPLHADLAAAYLVRAGLRQEPYDLLRALAAAESSLQADPRLPQALFNRALILDRLGLRAAAVAAWQRFVSVDPASGWSREARARLDALARQAAVSAAGQRAALRAATERGDRSEVQRLALVSPQAARELACDELLPDWGAAVLCGDRPGAQRALAAARELGSALAAAGLDQTAAQAVAAIERASAPAVQQQLARAHVDYRLGSRLYATLRVEEASPPLRSARAAMDRAGSPLALWAAGLLAGIELARSAPERAAAAFERLTRQADSMRTPALSGRLLWGLGLVRGREGRLTEALAYYRRSAEAFGRAREAVNQARVEALIAEALKYLGQTEAGWSHRVHALAVLEGLPGSRDLHGQLWEAADALLQDGQPGLALVFQQEDVEAARRSAQAFMRAEAKLRMSRVLAAQQQPAAALRALAEARAWNSQGGSAATAAGTAAQIDQQEGEVLRRLDPVGAQRLLDRAIGRLLALKRPLEAPLAYLSRARARLAAGADGAAEEDLAAAIDRVSRARALVADPGFRQSFAEGAQGFFDELILLRSRRPRPEWATLEAIERARTLAAQSSFERIRGTPSAARLARDLKALPRDVALVEFALIGNRLFRWVLTREGIELQVRAVHLAALAARVNRFVAAVRGGGSAAEIASASSPLYPYLVPGASAAVPAGARLVFIPDRLLNAVPFAALRDPQGGRYLIEEHCVGLAPSATAYLAAATRHAAAPPRQWSALLVDDPDFDRELFPQLARLSGTRAETDEARRVFPASQVLSGRAAVRARLLAELGHHQVFGFAGHAIFNARLPLDSYLVLAPAADRADSGQLFARDLVGRRLDVLQLVVLSACHTVAATSRRGTGLSGLTAPFLDAGAAAVLATLWDVQDAAASALVSEFYRRFRVSGDAGAALRASQLAAIRGTDSSLHTPAAWASFQLVGELRQPSP
jgi:hypothetical protein